mmetsp:Transcript_27376/g.40270  ORF Transcript_27376/g.40270 Transcript_27376/m.40270 type:complete len:200 (-) Transcript_27376:1310-1909(-)
MFHLHTICRWSRHIQRHSPCTASAFWRKLGGCEAIPETWARHFKRPPLYTRRRRACGCGPHIDGRTACSRLFGGVAALQNLARLGKYNKLIRHEGLHEFKRLINSMARIFHHPFNQEGRGAKSNARVLGVVCQRCGIPIPLRARKLEVDTIRAPRTQGFAGIPPHFLKERQVLDLSKTQISEAQAQQSHFCHRHNVPKI